MPHFNEHALELSIMELFQQEGYIYTNGEEIHKICVVGIKLMALRLWRLSVCSPC